MIENIIEIEGTMILPLHRRRQRTHRSVIFSDKKFGIATMYILYFAWYTLWSFSE